MRRALGIAVLLFMTACDSPKGAPDQNAAATKAAPLPPAYGDMLVEAGSADASNLIPMFAADTSSANIAGLVFSGLVRYNADWKLEGELAESWDIKDDGKTIIFHLRKGVTWQDGAPFTSADVMFGYKTIIAPNTPTPYSEDFRQVTKAEAPDDHTFIVHYDKPFAPALASWGALVVLPKHLLEGKDLTKEKFARNPVGIGPYRFKEWKTQERIMLEANKAYFEGEPYISRYTYRIIPDTATQFLELKAGSIDMMGLTPVQYDKQTQNPEFQRNFLRFSYVANAYTYLGYNLQRPLFKDVRVRRAIAHAIDKEEVVRGAQLGFGVPAYGPYKPGSWQNNPNVPQYPYSPDKAKALLAEAGWMQKGADGILVKDGKRFAFELITNHGNDQRKKAAEIIQQRLKDVGIEVTIRVVEWSSFLKEFINKRNFDVTILGWTVTPDPDLYDIWHSSKTGENEFNFVSYKNNEVDRLLEEGRRSFDQKARKAAYDRLQQILAEDQPYCWLYWPEALPTVSARVQGIELHAATTGIGYNWPMHWYVPKPLQKYTIAP